MPHRFHKGDIAVVKATGKVVDVAHQQGDWVLTRQRPTGLQWTFKSTDLEPSEVCPI